MKEGTVIGGIMAILPILNKTVSTLSVFNQKSLNFLALRSIFL